MADVKKVRDTEEALALFHDYETTGFRHDYSSYASLVYRLARFNDFDTIDACLAELRETDIPCGETIFVALIQRYSKAGMVDKALKLFHEIPSFNCDRTAQSLNALLDALVAGGRFSEARTLFHRSRLMGLYPNTATFNVMIKGWLGRGDLEGARKMFDEMLQSKLRPSVATYNSMIGYLSRNGEVGEAKRLLRDMFEKRTKPNAVTYMLVMEGLCLAGKPDEAKKLMFDMEYRGCKTEAVNFAALMSDLGRRGKIEDAKPLLDEMRTRRVKPDVVIYNILINYMCKEGKGSEAYKVWIGMEVEGNAATYRTLLDGLCRAGDFGRGLKVFKAVTATRHFPRRESFPCLVAGLVRSGDLRGACFVLEEMGNRKMGLAFECWEALVSEACGGNLGQQIGLLTGLLITSK